MPFAKPTPMIIPDKIIAAPLPPNAPQNLDTAIMGILFTHGMASGGNAFHTLISIYNKGRDCEGDSRILLQLQMPREITDCDGVVKMVRLVNPDYTIPEPVRQVLKMVAPKIENITTWMHVAFVHAQDLSFPRWVSDYRLNLNESNRTAYQRGLDQGLMESGIHVLTGKFGGLFQARRQPR